jgi:hypothetical protein
LNVIPVIYTITFTYGNRGTYSYVHRLVEVDLGKSRSDPAAISAYNIMLSRGTHTDREAQLTVAKKERTVSYVHFLKLLWSAVM